MTDKKRPLKVFLCHAHDDKLKARELFRYLKRRGIQPWLDAENLLPGQDWRLEIPKALESSDAIIICLSKGSVDKAGYVQKEIKFALDRALEMPDGRIFIIPVRLDECEVPYGLKKYQWVDLFNEDGYSKLMKSLKERASQLERAAVQVSKQEENSPYLAENLKEVSHNGISVNVNGNVQGNIIIGNENAVQSQTAQPTLEKQVGPKPPVVIEKKEPDRPVSPPPTKEKDPEKPPHKLKPGYIIAIIGAAATILAALIGVLPQIIKPAPVPTGSITSISPTITPTLTPAPTASHELIDIDPSGNKIPMRLVPAGNFIMGSNVSEAMVECQKYNSNCQPTPFWDEVPPHQVYLADYYMDVYEVTTALYKACVIANICTLPENTERYYNSNYFAHPVVFVDWDLADTYCKWRGAHLTTEAEWEKAARGIDTRTYPWGEGINCSLANASKSCVGDTKAVGSYPAGVSPYGMYDMAGNVWEWVADWYAAYPNSTINDSNYGTQYRVLRGGAYDNDWNYFDRSSGRIKSEPVKTHNDAGFRCARPLP